MECLFAILALVALGVPVVAVILGVIALRRIRDLEARLAELDFDLASLRRGEVRPDRERAAPAAPALGPEPSGPPEPLEPPRPPATVLGEPAHSALEVPDTTEEPPTPPTPPPSPPSRPSFDWERWIGVRGAAAVAGILFALAGLYFVRYSIEAGWLAPPVRVALGLVAGVAALLGSEGLRRRGYPDASNGLGGGGVVVLYAAIWAARILYALIPTALAFGLMVLVTAVCGLLAWRRSSLVVATLGLVGGFATPLLVGAETESPLGLFGYLLVLNLGLLMLARRRRWPLLPPLALLATLFYEALWIASGMEPGELLLALGILVVFAALFVVTGLRPPRRMPGEGETGEIPSGLWSATRAGGLLLPFAFGLYFASRADLGEHLWPVAAMLLVLSVAAEVLGRGWMGEGELDWLGGAAAAASVAVVAVWALGRAEGGAAAWELTGIAAALALAFHAFFELDRRREATEPRPEPHPKPDSDPAPREGIELFTGALVAAAGLFGLLILDALADPAPYAAARLAGWALLVALLTRQAVRPGSGWLRAAAAVPLGAALPLFHLAHRRHADFPDPVLFFALLVAAAVALQLLASLGRGRSSPAAGPEREPWAERAAAALPLAALAMLTAQAGLPELAPWLYLATTLVLGVLAALAATLLPPRQGGGASGGSWLFAAMLLTGLDHLLWSFAVVLERAPAAEAPAAALDQGLGAGALAVLFFTAWPFLTRPRLDSERWAWYAAALAAPLWFFMLRNLWLERFGADAIGILAVALGAVSLAATFRVRTLWSADDPRRLRGLVWFAAVALGFAALAVPLQLDREWVTLGWALEGVATIVLWRRLDHPGLKLFGLTLLVTAAARLLLQTDGATGAGWLAYTHLIPAAALVGASLALAPLEVERLRAFERRFYPGGFPDTRPWGSLLTGGAAIVVVFAWITRTVFELFEAGIVAGASTMARDLTLSLAWALYALVLLGLGFARSSRVLRGIGLGLMTLTVVKVFLLDLADLEDLYRVASLAGLALSLILVSLAYQRFVFRPSEPHGEGRDGRDEAKETEGGDR